MVVEGHRQYNPGWHLAIDLRNMLIVSRGDRQGGAGARGVARRSHPRRLPEDRHDEWGTKNLVVTLDADGTGVDLHEKPLPVMPDELKKYFDGVREVSDRWATT